MKACPAMMSCCLALVGCHARRGIHDVRCGICVADAAGPSVGVVRVAGVRAEQCRDGRRMVLTGIAGPWRACLWVNEREGGG